MKAAEKEILISFLGKTLNLTAEDVAPIFEKKGDDEELKPDALKFLLGHDVTRIKTIKDETANVEKTSFDKGYKKAQAEIMSKHDKELKTKYGVDSEKQGLELIEEIVATKLGSEKLDADKVKVHPEYLKMEKELNKKIAEEKSTWEKKFNDRETELAKEKTFSSVLGEAYKELDVLKVILPSDAKKAANQKKLIELELKGMTYEQQGDEIIVLKPDGKRLEDAHGKPVSFKSFVKETADKYFDFEQGQSRQGSGASNDGKQGQQTQVAAAKKWAGSIPKNDDEYSQMFSKTTSAEDRIALTEAYEASQTSV